MKYINPYCNGTELNNKHNKTTSPRTDVCIGGGNDCCAL